MEETRDPARLSHGCAKWEEPCQICGEPAPVRIEVGGRTVSGEKIVRGYFLCERHAEEFAGELCRMIKEGDDSDE